jgi:rubrerythrin
MALKGNLSRLYPGLANPIYCENGCGAVIELMQAFQSYKRTSDEYGDNRPLLICECCASEEGYLYEDEDAPDETPVCHRKPKVKLR